ncbi:ERCC4 domain-containing protein [bacterium]|nr:ERCC4 domain-containing protein [bacterium]
MIAPAKLQIIVDTREQTPWHFSPELVDVTKRGLSAGDYSLLHDSLYAIERKSVDDFVGTVSSGWERFLRELARMEGMVARTIIVEGSMMRIIDHDYNHPRVLPSFVLKQVATLSLMGVSVLFADNPALAAGLAYKILKERNDQIIKNKS